MPLLRPLKLDKCSRHFLELLTVFSLVYSEEGSIAETSVKILIITASVLQFLNLRFLDQYGIHNDNRQTTDIWAYK